MHAYCVRLGTDAEDLFSCVLPRRMTSLTRCPASSPLQARSALLFVMQKCDSPLICSRSRQRPPTASHDVRAFPVGQLHSHSSTAHALLIHVSRPTPMYTDSSLIASVVSLVGALIGTYNTDSLGRRKVLIFGTLLCAAVLACAMGTSAASNVTVDTDTSVTDSSSINHPASRAAVAFLILFGAAYGWAYQPLLPVYPSEVLSMDMRSTGMGLMVLSLNLACD